MFERTRRSLASAFPRTTATNAVLPPPPTLLRESKAWVVFDPIAGTVASPDAKCDETTLLGVNYSETELPKVRVDFVQLGKSWMHFRLNAAGANPIFKPASPDIDVHAAITASVADRRLDLTGELTGDRFPNFEVILQDEVKTRRMVMSYETSGNRWTGPETDLWRDRKRHMNANCKSFAIDDHGHFA